MVGCDDVWSVGSCIGCTASDTPSSSTKAITSASCSSLSFIVYNGKPTLPRALTHSLANSRSVHPNNKNNNTVWYGFLSAMKKRKSATEGGGLDAIMNESCTYKTYSGRPPVEIFVPFTHSFVNTHSSRTSTRPFSQLQAHSIDQSTL
jgi:hypothetical protein